MKKSRLVLYLMRIKFMRRILHIDVITHPNNENVQNYYCHQALCL